RIGRGGFGRVYRARPRNARQYGLGAEFVAIKVVDKRALKDSAAEMRLATEVAVHESVNHPNVVQLFDSFEDGRYVYLVMEYCEGGDLWRHLRSRAPPARGGHADAGLAPLHEDEARTVMAQIAAAVVYLHANGVMHRDLKLANILLTRAMDVRVGDFGLATRVQNAAEPMTMCGTPSYISPEIMARMPYGRESDVWALGCLFVTLLTGAQPFRGLHKITEDAVARIPLPALSPDARHLVRSLLRVDPRRRIRSDELLEHPFFSGQPSAMPLHPDAVPRRVLPPRHPGAFAAAGPTASAAVDTLAHPHIDRGGGILSRAASDDLPRYARPAAEPGSGYARAEPQTATVAASPPTPRSAKHGAVDLGALTTRRMQPMKRSLKNGKVVLRDDRLLVLDLTTSPTVVALDEQRREIYEFKRPIPEIEALAARDASRMHPWDMKALPERVAKAVRVACRCISYLLSQQKRIKIGTPQGRGYMFDDLSTFKVAFFNGISVEVSRDRMEATVAIPSRQDLPNEIQKIALRPSDLPRMPSDSEEDEEGFGAERHHDSWDGRIPPKIRGIWEHAREAVRQMCAFDAVLREFEDGGRRAQQFQGQIRFPVEVQWGWNPTAEYVPPGLARGRPEKAAFPFGRGGGLGGRPHSTAVHTMGSTTIVGSKQPQQQQQPPPAQAQWGEHLLDRRTVDDTPTRRLNLGPITRLVEEFNKMPKPTHGPAAAGADFLRTPGAFLRTPGGIAKDAAAHEAMLQAFDGACFIPDVGWCMAAEGADPDDYLITILFCDGCRILVKVKGQTISFRDGAVEHHDLPFDHSMPARVKERLSWLPRFLGAMGLGI
ncbi:hypothetical protein IWQ57_002639, partial [Coemansia nantahalensis]